MYARYHAILIQPNVSTGTLNAGEWYATDGVPNRTGGT
jgi:hypothetical protein